MAVRNFRHLRLPTGGLRLRAVQVFRISDCGLKKCEAKPHVGNNQQSTIVGCAHPRNQQSGQASVWAMLVLLVLIIVGAALLDAYQWTSTRVWAYHAAEAAAERGATAGADWSHFQYSGEWQLNSAAARSEVEAALREELSARGIDVSRVWWDIRIHSTSDTVTETGWPPKGSLWASNWTTDRPSVGVYLELDTPAFLGGLAGIEQWARVHVFASSSLVR